MWTSHAMKLHPSGLSCLASLTGRAFPSPRPAHVPPTSRRCFPPLLPSESIRPLALVDACGIPTFWLLCTFTDQFWLEPLFLGFWGVHLQGGLGGNLIQPLGVKEGSWGPLCLLLMLRCSGPRACAGPATPWPQFRIGGSSEGGGICREAALQCSFLSPQACGSPCPPRHSQTPRSPRSPRSCQSPPTIGPAPRKPWAPGLHSVAGTTPNSGSEPPGSSEKITAPGPRPERGSLSSNPPDGGGAPAHPDLGCRGAGTPLPFVADVSP